MAIETAPTVGPRAGVTVLPISVDSVPTLKEDKAKYAMKQDLLSDFRRDVSRIRAL